MSLNEVVRQNIDSLAASARRQTLAFTDPESHTAVEVVFDHIETLGCQVWEASVTHSADTMKTVSLADWSKRVADEVTGLLEPLKVVEIDPNLGTALLRSEQPAEKGTELFYYEVTLSLAGTACIRRYRSAKEPVKREQVGFVMTREAVAKLVVDLAVDL